MCEEVKDKEDISRWPIDLKIVVFERPSNWKSVPRGSIAYEFEWNLLVTIGIRGRLGWSNSVHVTYRVLVIEVGAEIIKKNGAHQNIYHKDNYTVASDLRRCCRRKEVAKWIIRLHLQDCENDLNICQEWKVRAEQLQQTYGSITGLIWEEKNLQTWYSIKTYTKLGGNMLSIEPIQSCFNTNFDPVQVPRGTQHYARKITVNPRLRSTL